MIPIKPIDTFEYAFSRSDHFLKLYEILHDSGQRGGRRDWMDSFKALMKWPKAEKVVRIDGANKNSILLIREVHGIERSHFAHDYVSELLRSSVVSAISALDRYMHDVVVDKSWSLLSKPEKQIPKELKKVKLPLLAT